MKKIVIHFILFLIILFSICKESYPQLGESWYYFCKSEKILAFAEMEDILWVGCYNGLVKYSKSTQEFQVFNKANSSLMDNHIISLASDNSNTLWIVTFDGNVNSYNNGTWQIIDTLNNLFTSYSDVVVDNDNRK